MHFQEFIFQQGNAFVHKSKIIGTIFQEKVWNVLECPIYSQHLNAVENLRSILNQSKRKQFYEKIRSARNLYENYTNRLIDVKKVQ